MAKTLCDWTRKDIERNAALLEALLRDPRYFCRKCARGACTSEVLCKPRRIKRAHDPLAPDEVKAEQENAAE